jgi:hypothetical protein
MYFLLKRRTFLSDKHRTYNLCHRLRNPCPKPLYPSATAGTLEIVNLCLLDKLPRLNANAYRKEYSITAELHFHNWRGSFVTDQQITVT